MKRIVAILLAMVMLFTSGGEILAAQVTDGNSNVAIETSRKDLPTGLMEPVVNELPESEMPEEALDCKDMVSINKYSAVYNHDWDKYSTNYYYNLLSEDEKALWDALDELCIYYLNNPVSIAYDSYTKDHPFETVKIPFEMTQDELHVFWQFFMISNPQYYFLQNSYWRYNSGNLATGIMLVCYDAFADGTARATATQKVKAQIEEWESIIAQYRTNEEKLQVIYELVCEKVTYNYDIIDDGYITSEEESVYFSQSAYSVFCTDTTVCAGYSDAMAVMCNGIGLDAVSVTSYNHQWNKVRMNDVWYNYDATWGDSGDVTNYIYYARSDAFYASDDSSHVEEDFWNGYSPNAVIDVPPAGYYNPGTYPQIHNMTATPSISVTRENTGYIVSFYCNTPNATIYYTLDGTDPSSAFTKSIKYMGVPIVLDKSCEIKAMAVCDGWLDSYTQTASVVENMYTISYVLDGGTNDSRNPSSVSEFASEFELYPATRAGYNFVGWYYDSSYTQPVGKIVGLAQNISVYAKWDKIVESLEGAKVTLSKSKYDYSGKENKPTVTVTLNGKTLVKNKDYKVDYKNNKNIGKATVIVKGINGYKGTIEKKFTIAEKKGATFNSGSNQYKVTSSTAVTFIGRKKGSTTTTIKIPDNVTYGGKKFKVTAIASKALRKTNVKKVTIGANVTSIGSSAFAGCTKLTQVTIGKKVKTIGVSAFEGCKKLTKVTIGSAVTTIDDKAFKNCTALTKITIPSKVTKIDKQAFYGCKKLKSIVFKPTKLPKIGKEIFKGISSKATIQVPKKQLKKYQTLLKNSGQSKKVQIVKAK